MRYVFVLVTAFAALVSGCGTSATRSARPTEVETREAYLGTPVIVDEQGRKVPLGTTRKAVERKLGSAAITYLRRVEGAYRGCIIYPINGTQVWDRYGSPEADEWEFCFDRGRVMTKRRIRAGTRGTARR